MSAPEPEPQEREPIELLMDLLDLCAVVDRLAPAYRYVSTKQLRELVVDGWRAA